MYLVTGASGFIGKHLLDLLVRRRTLAVGALPDRRVAGRGVQPLVRTPMIAPTRIDEAFPTRSPDEAVDMIIDGIVHRKKRVATRLGIFGEVSYALVPKVIDRVLNTGYRLFPGSPPKGKEEEQVHPGPEAVAFAYILHGIHW
jgi:N-acetyl-gamma-glutamylphosphate reductase